MFYEVLEERVPEISLNIYFICNLLFPYPTFFNNIFHISKHRSLVDSLTSGAFFQLDGDLDNDLLVN